jgi:hypothetical protein
VADGGCISFENRLNFMTFCTLCCNDHKWGVQQMLRAAAMICMVALTLRASEAGAVSLLSDIARTAHQIDRNLCKMNPADSQCRPNHRKTKIAAKHVAPKAGTAARPTTSIVRLPPPAKQVSPPVPVVAGKAAAGPIPVPRPKLKPAGLVPVTKTAASVVPPVVAPAPAHPVVPIVVPLPPLPEDGSGCLTTLGAEGAAFSPVPQPSAVVGCAILNPVRLFGVKTPDGQVKLPDQPVLNCAFALKFSRWIAARIEPLAQADLSVALTALGTGPGFDCRGRTGDSAAKMSEHATGNAVDIVYLTFSDKKRVLVKDALDEKAPGFAMLGDVRASACQDFATVLGPGINEAHREHFHIDLEQRRTGSKFRLCE